MGKSDFEYLHNLQAVWGGGEIENNTIYLRRWKATLEQNFIVIVRADFEENVILYFFLK